MKIEIEVFYNFEFLLHYIISRVSNGTRKRDHDSNLLSASSTDALLAQINAATSGNDDEFGIIV